MSNNPRILPTHQTTSNHTMSLVNTLFIVLTVISAISEGPTTKYPCPVCARNVTSRGVSYVCNRCSGWVLVFKTQWSTDALSTGYAALAVPHPPTQPKPQPLPTSLPIQFVDGNSFTIMQFNANGIGNKLTELCEFLERHNVKVAVMQESKLSSNSKTPSIHNFTTVRKHRHQGP